MENPSRAVLFADVCDSTTIYETFGDAHALPLINRLLGQIHKQVGANGGVVVKMLGDGLVCHFGRPDEAYRAACNMQMAALMLAKGYGPKLEVKVALAYGPVIAEQADVFGDTVNVAARLAAMAKGGQVLTTQQTVEGLSPPLQQGCRHLYRTRVKGRYEEVEVFEVLWRSDPDLTRTDFPPSGLASHGKWVLKLSYAGNAFVVKPQGVLRLGRDKDNEVVVPSVRASRLHARIFERDGNFILADLSSNGTFVQADGVPREVMVRRQELVLGERGWIGLGGSAASHGDHVLRFRLERDGP